MADFGSMFKNSTAKKTDGRPRNETKWIHYTKLIDNRDQYRKSATKEDIAALAELIHSAGKVLQDLLVRKAGPDSYEIVAGHHRRLACKYLVEEKGLKEYEFLPCKVENVNDIQAEFQVYATNGFMPKTDAEKLHEIERMKYLLEKYPEQFPELEKGRTIEKIAHIMNMGKTAVGDYVTISKNLSDKGREAFDKGNLNKSTALALSSLPEQEQDKLIASGATLKSVNAHKNKNATKPSLSNTDTASAIRMNTSWPEKKSAETDKIPNQYRFTNIDLKIEEEQNTETEIQKYDLNYFLDEQMDILARLKSASRIDPEYEKDLARARYIVKGLCKLLQEEG